MSRIAGCLCVLFLTGCFVDRAGRRVADPGPMDAGARDAGARDAGRADASRPDGATDAGPPDAGLPDAGPPDAGCDAGTPPALTVWAPPASAPALDGDLTDWSGFGWVSIAAPDDFRSDLGQPGATGPDDLSARLAARWAPDALWIAVEVTDDEHHGGSPGASLWTGDSVQVAFDVGRNGGSYYDTTDDFEYGYTLATLGTPERFRWIAPAGASPAADEARITRDGARTRYEIRLTPSDLGLSAFDAGAAVGFAFIVNENDDMGVSRQGFLEWASGIGHGKEPDAFGVLELLASGCP